MHLISLELGGAANDRRNLWPEPGASPNLKDKVENYLHLRVRDGRMLLARAQRIIALGWVTLYNQNLKPKPKAPPPPSSPPDEGVAHPGAFCAPQGGDRPHQRGNAHGVRASLRRTRSLAERLEREATKVGLPLRASNQLPPASRVVVGLLSGGEVAPERDQGDGPQRYLVPWRGVADCGRE